MDSKVISLEIFNEICPIISRACVKDARAFCRICKVKYSDDGRQSEPLREMPRCGHRFHQHCLAKWLTWYGIRCPFCQEPVTFIDTLLQEADVLRCSILVQSMVEDTSIEPTPSTDRAAVQKIDIYAPHTQVHDSGTPSPSPRNREE